MTLRPVWDTGGISKGVGGNLTVLDPSILLVLLLYSIPFHSTIMNTVTE